MTMSTPNKPGGNGLPPPRDYIFFCDICGLIEWAKNGTKLGIYTGFGGAIVCPRCVYAVDYALVPYTVPAEQPVPWARQDSYYDAPPSTIFQEFPPFNFNIVPGSGSAGEYADYAKPINEQLDVFIEEMNLLQINLQLPT